MPTDIQSTLPDLHPIYNPLVIQLADGAAPASANVGTTTCEIQVEVEDILDSDVWRMVAEYLNPYDYTTDRASVSIHKALQSAFTPNPAPLTENTPQVVPGIIKRYRLLARDLIDGVSSGGFQASGSGYAWQAGNRSNNLTRDRITGNSYIFLSRMPSARRIAKREDISLQILCLQAASGAGIAVTSTLPDGSTTSLTFPLGDLAQYRVYSFTIPGPSGTAANPIRMQVSIAAAGFSAATPSITYTTTPNPSPWSEELFMRNSLGGWDKIYCTGKSQSAQAFASEVFEAQAYPDPMGAAGRGSSRSFNQRANQQLILRTGFYSLSEHRAMMDLILRNEAYLINGNQLLPLIITNSSEVEDTDGSYLHACELTARYAYDNHAL